MNYEPILHIVLHQPEIPQNTGNIGRSCVALGAKLWLVRPLGFQLDEKHLRRAGMDYWQQLEWEVVDQWDDLVKQIPVERHWYLSRWATKSYSSVEFQTGDALVFGSETAGLPRGIWQDSSRALRIPMRPDIRSLNLGSSAAVCMFEAARQFSDQGLLNLE